MNNNKLNNSGSYQGVQVISRAADILRALRDDKNGLSLGQIAKRVNLPRSTVQRIVNALLQEHLLMMASSEGGLRLGPEIQFLAAAGRINVVEVIHPLLVELTKKTEETTDLAIFKDSQMIFVDQIEGLHRLRTFSAVGEAFPLSDTANGKSVLAMLEDEIAASLVAQELRKKIVKKRTLSNIIREIEQVRENGYAFDIEEHTDGVSAIGTAFFGPDGAIYALSIPVPSNRFPTKKGELIKQIMSTKKSIVNLVNAKEIGD